MFAVRPRYAHTIIYNITICTLQSALGPFLPDPNFISLLYITRVKIASYLYPYKILAITMPLELA